MSDPVKPAGGKPVKLNRLDVMAELIKLHFQGQDKEFAARVKAVADQLEAEGANGEAYMFRAAMRNAKARPEKPQTPAPKGSELRPVRGGRDQADTEELASRPAIRVPHELSGFLYQLRPKLSLAEMILDALTRRAAEKFLRDLQASEVLEMHGLLPVRTLLLHGPPGDGKTTLAGALALELDLPFFVLRLAELRSCYFGGSEQNVARAFKFVAQHELVLFLDEADSLLHNRGSAGHNSQILDSQTNAMLTGLDELPPQVYVFAATNRIDAIDPAARRRFEVTLELHAPGAAELASYVERFLRGIAGQFKVDLPPARAGELAASAGLSFGVLEQRLNAALRDYVIELAHTKRAGGKPAVTLGQAIEAALQQPGPPSQLPQQEGISIADLLQSLALNCVASTKDERSA